MKKLTALIAFGAGYVFGTKAGRERYEKIKQTFGKVKDDPRVQEKAHQAADMAREKAPVMKDKMSSAAESAAHKAKGDSGPDPVEQLDREQADKLNRDSTMFQKDPYPEGPLP